MCNITRVVTINPALTGQAFVDENGFFIRVETSGYLKYCPVGNKSDVEAIEKYFDASYIFVDPEMCRKVFPSITAGGQRSMAQVIYVGYGV